MMNRGPDFYGYLTLFWRDIFHISDRESFGDFHFDRYHDAPPEHTPAYDAGGVVDWARHQLPLWRLFPLSFWQAINRKDDLGRCVSAYEVLRAVIPIVMLRRTQASVLLVNGAYIRIGDSIPPYTICTVELAWQDETQFQAYNKIFQSYVKYLSSGAATDRGAVNFRVPGSSRRGQSVKGNVGTRSFAIHRIMTIMTFNPGLHKVILRSGGKNLVSNVHTWYEKFQDKGMSFYFDLTKAERDLPLYIDRYSMSLYLAKDSPKLMYLAKLMGEICLDEVDPRRALIFTDGPMTLWNTEGFLTVGVETIVSSPHPSPSPPLAWPTLTSVRARIWGLPLRHSAATWTPRSARPSSTISTTRRVSCTPCCSTSSRPTPA
jgi:hypothetical protein